jgi:hypothetical protein
MTWKPDQILQAYLDHALNIRGTQQPHPSPAELQAVARELGMTSEDLAAADAEAEKCFTRGQGFLEHGHLEDAIKDLSRAAALRPLHLDTVLALAWAHVKQWRATHQGNHRAQAERLARFCLDVNPRLEGAFAVLSALKQPKAKTPAVPVLVVSTALFGLVVAGGVVAVMLRGPITAPPAANVGTKRLVERNPPIPAAGAVPVAVSVSSDGDSAGFTFQAHHSQLTRYPERAFYKLNGLLSQTTGKEIHALDVKIELLDETGATVQSEVRHVLGTLMQPPHRPKDTIALGLMVQAPATVTAARLVVVALDARPGAAKYAPATPLVLQGLKPPFEVGLGIRDIYVTPVFNEAASWCTVVLEIRNAGETQVGTLKFQLRTIAGANPPSNTVVQLAGALHPPLFPGETRVHKHVFKTGAGAVASELVLAAEALDVR